MKQIAERFGVHRTTISKIVTSAGVKVRSQPLASSTRDEARHLYNSGRSLAQAAEQLGVSASAVRSAVLVAGGSLWPAGGSTRNRAHGAAHRVSALDPQADETAVGVAGEARGSDARRAVGGWSPWASSSDMRNRPGVRLPAGAQRRGSAALVDLGRGDSSPYATPRTFCYLPTCILMRVPSLMSWA